MEKKNYIPWINIAKAIGIIAVVLDHLFLADSVFRRIINICTAPFFFFISGLNYHRDTDFKNFFIKKFKRMYLPYLGVGLISMAVYLVLANFINLGITVNTQSIANCFLGLIYANASVGDMMWNRPLWFLPSLFVTSLLYNIIDRTDHKVLKGFSVLVLTGLGMYLSFYQYHLPFQAETSLSMLIWYYLGNISKPYLIKNKSDTSVIVKILLLIVFASSSIILGLLNNRIEVIIGFYGNSWALYYISCLLGICAMTEASQLMTETKVLKWIGNNTIFILAWSKFPTEFIQLIPIFKTGLLSENLIIQLIVLVILAALVIFLVWLFQWILKKIKIYPYVRKFIG